MEILLNRDGHINWKGSNGNVGIDTEREREEEGYKVTNKCTIARNVQKDNSIFQ